MKESRMAGGKRGRPKGSKNSFRLGDLKGSYYETITENRKSSVSISGDVDFRIFIEPTPISDLVKNDVVMLADGKVAQFINSFVDGLGHEYASVTFDGYKTFTYDRRAIKRKKPNRKENK
jgi:hypothetical protein